MISAPAGAQQPLVLGSGQASTSIPLAAPPPAEPPPAEKRAIKLSQLLGQLHGARAATDTRKIEAEIWNIWSRNDSPTAEVLLRQSSAAITARDFEPAERMLSQLVKTYPTYAEGWNRRASLYYLMKRYGAAMSDLDRALDLEPRNFGALLGKGMILHATGKGEDAIAAFKEALAINPHLNAAKAAIKQIEKAEPRI